MGYQGQVEELPWSVVAIVVVSFKVVRVATGAGVLGCQLSGEGVV